MTVLTQPALADEQLQVLDGNWRGRETQEHGEDLPEVRDWAWPGRPAARA